MKGGHPSSGPAPDPQALRRDRDRASWTHLPAEGRQGEVPPWPLSKATAREQGLWDGEWRRPQAVMWEANGQQLEVAIYVRTLRQAESPRASVALRTLLRQQQESLGLSLPGLARNRWIIATSVSAPARVAATGTEGRPSIRDRMKVVDGGG
jgi:hypothetical protein